MEQNDLAAKGVKRADNENFCIIKSQRKQHKNVDEKKIIIIIIMEKLPATKKNMKNYLDFSNTGIFQNSTTALYSDQEIHPTRSIVEQ